ncbi:molybdopterin-dependent oxidoreductase [Trinickia dinghuensis]|uniref:Ferredoxin:oxidoreductase FAD/NAD(P)-binding protein n=1 Tax=Trinickia dinghuensis TaxID=2291023 RepID=A0A3D8K7N0_9BURK|nr:molybdopterin-dependent oxidoreductase [Trinickia dinghuensis]RDV00895.1 ferredoxin:oxidoreductase FAD/NAD(P)-binding protein [Trinickia dinghuensis]
METQEKKGYCTLCRSRCGTINTVRGGMMLKVRPDNTHPTGSAMCMKGKAAPELVHSPNRVLYPMRRTAPKGAADPGWQRISWDEAMGEIATTLAHLKRESGAESVVFGVTTPSGTPMSDSIDWVERFVWAFGSPNICYATEICNWHKDFAHMFTFGCGMPTADYRNAEVIVLWGTNPANTWLAQADSIAQGRRKGAKLIVVDPRPTALAREAEVWLRVRPGTDGALAMGIARQMIATGQIDDAFVREWTNGAMLVRQDNGLFLRERDIDPKSTSNRHAVWNGTLDRHEFVGEEPTTTPSDLALRGTHEVGVFDAAGRATTVTCRPAFELFCDALAIYTPEHVSDITGVRAADIETVAAMLGPHQRIAYHAWSGVGQHTNATQTERSIATLYALTGAFDTRGSNRELAKQPTNPVSDYAMLSPRQRAKALGLEERPLGPPAQGWVTARDVYRAILDGTPYRVRALMAFGTNMVMSQADIGMAHDALCALDFHVHCDLFETPTSRYADILLPVNTPWEREGLRLGFEINERAVELVQLRQRMVPPRGESRADYDIVFDLAMRLGMGEQFFGGSIEAGWNHMLEPIGLDVATLRAHPEGVYRPLEQRERQYACATPTGPRGFRTETGRVELYSEKLHRHGYPAVPQYVAPQHGSGALAEDHRRYPYTLTSIKNGYYCHSQQRGVPSLRRRAPYPIAELGAALAVTKGIADGDWIRVTSASGTARFRASVVPELAPDVIVAEYGWWQACEEIGMEALAPSGNASSNYNALVSGAIVDPLSGSSPLRAVPCDVALDPSVDRTRRAWEGFRDCVVSAIRVDADGVRSVTICAADGGLLPDYLPGQHVTVHAPVLGEGGTTRAYSLTGRATEAGRRSYSIAVRHQRGRDASDKPFEGAMSSYIHRELAVGHKLLLRAPSGTFIVPPASKQPIVLFAGGIGITPFMSWLETIGEQGAQAPESWLFYANQNSATHAFRKRIAHWQRRLPMLTVVNCYNQPRNEVPGRDFELQGYLSADVVDEALIRRRARFYLCGPQPMMDAITAGLIERGVPPFDIFSEAFRSPSKPVLDPSQRFTVEFRRSRLKADWTPERGSLLSFGESMGIGMPSGCRVGQCESCAIKILAGKVSHLSGQGPDEPDMCLACQAIPVTHLCIDA